MLAEAWKWLVWIFSCAVCITEALWASLNPLSSPFVLWGLCALMSSPQASPVYHGAFAHLSLLPVPAICIVGLLFTCLSSLCPPSASWGFYALVSDHQTQGLCHGACVLVILACQPTLYVVGMGRGREGWCVLFSSPWACPLHPKVCVHCRGLYATAVLGPPSVPQGLCVLERFVCCATPGTPSPPINCRASVGFSQLPMPAISSGPQSMSSLQAEKCSFLCFLPSKSLLCLVLQDSTAPLWAQL